MFSWEEVKLIYIYSYLVENVFFFNEDGNVWIERTFCTFSNLLDLQLSARCVLTGREALLRLVDLKRFRLKNTGRSGSSD